MNYQLPLNQGKIDGIDVFVGIIISNEGRLELQDKSLASILQVRYESKEFIGDGLLENVVEAHDMRDIYEHCIGLVGPHHFHLRLIVSLVQPRSLIAPSLSLQELHEDILNLHLFLVYKHHTSPMYEEIGIVDPS
ncbi:Uncharacterized protein Fot_39501 [Forsythia ovata]|uniref:Uncharacterized protein n=1 Tax=Forsythia ovata TaxID=205694 RepID=A0ABD1S8M6_9LAMI